MQARTIKAIMRQKLNAWADSIKDEKVRDLVKENAIISGGAITSLLLNEKVNDFDVYFRTADTVYEVSRYYVNEFAKNPPVKFKGEDGKCIPIRITDAAKKEVFSAKEWAARRSRLRITRAEFLEKQRLIRRAGVPESLQKSFDEEHPPIIPDPADEANAAAGTEIDSYHASKQTFDPNRIYLYIASVGVASENGAETYQYFEGVPDRDAAGNFLDELTGAKAAIEGEPKVGEPAPAKAEDEVPKEKYRPVFITGNAITLSDGIQVTTRFYGEPGEIHGNYDFEHCKCYWSAWNSELSTPESALLAMMNRRLVYTGSRYPVCSIMRARKFIERGWNITAGQYLKMVLQVNDLDLRDYSVLEDQLIGVDTAFFAQVLREMEEHMTKNNLEKVDTAYLIELIDRIF